MGLQGLLTTYREVGCYKMGGGGHVKFYPHEKGEGRKNFSHAEGGAQQVLGWFYAVA